MNIKAIAIVDRSAVRDAQLCINTDYDPFDDDAWHDVSEPLYLGVFGGADKDTIRAKAAVYANTSPDNIRVYTLDELKGAPVHA